MEIVIIGTGNTATILGRKLKAAGHQIMQVCGRNRHAAVALANELNAEVVDRLNAGNQQGDLYILAVSDQAVASVSSQLQLENKIVVHTAASVPLNVLQGTSENYGVFYPLQSLKKEVQQLPAIPILIDANNPDTLQLLHGLAHTITDQVFVANDDLRVKMHLAAVMVNNFTNHLYTLMEVYCRKEGLDFSMLLPLIRETVSRLDKIAPSQAQTGPAVRKDTVTIEKHLALLETHPHLKNVYSFFTESILQNR